jgi:4-hydroxy-2-oxoheptanedioate aldolase
VAGRSPELGAFSFLASPELLAELAATDLDWICLDAQHGAWTDASLQQALALAPADGARLLVRVRSLDAGLIGRALDAGAAGVVVPLVDDVEQAEAAVRAVRYPPAGGRSFGPLRSRYGADTDAANAGVTCAVMIETPSAVQRVEAIAEVPGVDQLFVGPFDLSLSLGRTPDELLAADGPDDPLPRVLRAAAEAGIGCGAFAGEPVRAARLLELGFASVAVTTDRDLLARGVRAVRAELDA